MPSSETTTTSPSQEATLHKRFNSMTPRERQQEMRRRHTSTDGAECLLSPHRTKGAVHFLLAPLISSPFWFPLSRTVGAFYFLYLCLSFIYSLQVFQPPPPPPPPPPVPLALTDSVQSVANRVGVNLAPTHKQQAAHPPHQPASIPAAQEHTHRRAQTFLTGRVRSETAAFFVCLKAVDVINTWSASPRCSAGF